MGNWYAANDDLSPFESWWIAHGGAPDLSAHRVTVAVKYDEQMPCGNAGIWSPIQGYVAPTIESVCFNSHPSLALDSSRWKALTEWALLCFSYGGPELSLLSYRSVHLGLPPPAVIEWGAEDLDLMWARWATELDERIANDRSQPSTPDGPTRNALARLDHLSAAAWERFRHLPLVQANSCEEADYWALVNAHDSRFPTVDEAYEAQVATLTPPPIQGPGSVVPFRPRHSPR